MMDECEESSDIEMVSMEETIQVENKPNDPIKTVAKTVSRVLKPLSVSLYVNIIKSILNDLKCIYRYRRWKIFPIATAHLLQV